MNKYGLMINALKNETAIDAFDMLNVYKNRNCKLPVLRPIQLMEKFKSNVILKIVLYSLVLFWIILFPLLMLYKFMKYSKLIKKRDKNIILNESKIIVMTSHRVKTVKNGVDSSSLPSLYLSVPWLNTTVNEKNILSLMAFIKLFDLLKVLTYTFKGLLIWSKNINHPVEILQSYVLFEYFMMVLVLKKLEKENITSYWYSNHYDRWSVLLDGVGKRNTLLQHGFINENFKLPYRLKNLETLYFIDEKSIDIFKNNIIDMDEKTICIQLQNTLKLQVVKNSKKSILLISRPAQFNFDKELIEVLIKLDIFIYIKPHPCFDKSRYISAFKDKSKCLLIEDDDFYPDVPVIISGYSTLAVEYGLLGKNIIWIPMENIGSIEEKIIKQLGEINVQK